MLAPEQERQKPCPAWCFQNAEQGFRGREVQKRQVSTVWPEQMPESQREQRRPRPWESRGSR